MRIGVDTGGTFTDVVAVDDEGRLRLAKVASTPGDPAAAVLEGIARAMVGGARNEHSFRDALVVHGTTVATNALLTRSGGPTALVATRGFEDLLVLRRQARPRLYALEPEVPEPLISDAWRFGVAERLAPDGSVVLALDPATLAPLADELAARGVASVAVALLHSYAGAQHELAVAEALSRLGVPVSLSSEVLPEHREYERTTTTVADAYVAPVIGPYLARLQAALGASLRVMQSSGGASSVAEARRRPVRTLLSGPAAGVIGARAAAARAGAKRIITFDMGGTSTDVSLVDGEIELTREGEVAGLPIAVPQVAIHTVGAGGGSIARLDPGGALKVGPDSSGALPGPACYGGGGRSPTVTDAALLEGRLDAARFLGGAMRIDAALASRAIAPLALAMGVAPDEAARGIARVAVTVMARAIKVISVERGHDPRDFALVAFGGAGGMYACDVADELGMERVLIPAAPGLLCAYGALVADVTRDRTATRLAPAGETLYPSALAAEFLPLEAAVDADLDGEGVPVAERRFSRRVEMRYVGQSYELPIDIPALPCDLVAAFHDAHRRRLGFAAPERAVERVALRVAGRGLTAPPPPLTVVAAPGEPRLAAGVFDRARLASGAIVDGPAMVVELSATTWVAAGWRATVDDDGALHLTRR